MINFLILIYYFLRTADFHCMPEVFAILRGVWSSALSVRYFEQWQEAKRKMRDYDHRMCQFLLSGSV